MGKRGALGVKPLCFRPASATEVLILFSLGCNGEEARARTGRISEIIPASTSQTVEVQVGASDSVNIVSNCVNSF